MDIDKPDWEQGVTPDDGDQALELFPNVEAWVAGWLAPVIRRPLRGATVWCARWWEHPEAVCRLHALWKAWEEAIRGDGGALSYWWTMHFDAHWSTLTCEQGPFSACKDNNHSDKWGPLPHADPQHDDGGPGWLAREDLFLP